MRNVAGLFTADAQKSSDLFQKCRYLDELMGGKGVIFSTGRPYTHFDNAKKADNTSKINKYRLDFTK